MKGKNLLSVKLAAVFMSLSFMFVACGGDSDSGVNASAKVFEVDTTRELGPCADSLLGKTAFVVEDSAYYTCIEGEWITVDENPKSSDSGSARSSDSRTRVFPSSESKGVSGFAQKGPFLNGSSVILYELNGSTFEKTGRTLKGKVINDRGEFNIPDATYPIQYALLEVSGYYRNEVTGTKSSKKISLNALVDLSNRKKANINVLTHLEYKRVLYLVNTGMNFSSAKKQAEAEILKAFEITDKYDLADSLSLFGENEGNAVLLALSVLLQGDHTEAELSKLLTSIAEDFEKDGEWSDEAARVKIADWARIKSLDSIKTNISAWRIGAVSDTKKYVKNFWHTVYGIGACSENRVGEVVATKNEHSTTYGTQMRFICNKGGFWRGANDLEKDTYGEKCTEVGRMMNGKIVETNRYYCSANGWVSLFSWSWEVPREIHLNSENSYGTLRDSRDGKTYKTVTIGKLTWMAENLNYSDSITTPSLKGRSWCYDNVAANCDVTGRLYTWAAAIDSVKLANDKENPQTCGDGHSCFSGICGKEISCTQPLMLQGICPNGWHLPRQDEWDMLVKEASGTSVKELKSQTGWYTKCNGTNALGFSAIPSGFGGSNDFAGVSEEMIYDFWGVMHDYRYSYQVNGNQIVVITEEEGGYPLNSANFYIATRDEYPNTICIATINCYGIGFDICVLKDNGFAIRCVKDYNYADIL